MNEPTPDKYKPLPPTGTGKTIDACCAECSTVWVLAVLPMDVDKVGRLGKNAACPRCASTRVGIVAKGGVAQ